MRFPQLPRKTAAFVLAAFAVGIVVSGFVFGLMLYSTGAYYGVSASFGSVLQPWGSETLTGGLNDYSEVAMTAEAAAMAAESTQMQTVGRMMIYTARLSLKVANVDSAIDSIYSIAQNLGGDVAGISTSREGGRKAGVITVRVPQEDFYTAIRTIENLGQAESKEVRGEDVTEKHVDLSARLSNLEKQEQRLKEILAIATTVEDVLKVESELNKVRLQIEQLTGQIQYLENRVELATITVLLGEEAPWISVPEMNWGKTSRGWFVGSFRCHPRVNRSGNHGNAACRNRNPDILHLQTQSDQERSLFLEASTSPDRESA